MKKRLVVLISNAGTGTNLQSIIDSIKQNKMQAEIMAVLSDAADAYGLKRAEKAGIRTVLVGNSSDLLPILIKLRPDFICLAGWKQMIEDSVIDTYKDKILNIHPGLIPDTKDGKVLCPDGTTALWNKHKMTEKAIQNFSDNHATYAGSSLHFMTHEFDFGKVLGRCFEKIQKTDTVDSLYKRLKIKENRLYVACLIKLCSRV